MKASVAAPPSLRCSFFLLFDIFFLSLSFYPKKGADYGMKAFVAAPPSLRCSFFLFFNIFFLSLSFYPKKGADYGMEASEAAAPSLRCSFLSLFQHVLALSFFLSESDKGLRYEGFCSRTPDPQVQLSFSFFNIFFLSLSFYPKKGRYEGFCSRTP